jgi:hypothetical protein
MGEMWGRCGGDMREIYAHNQATRLRKESVLGVSSFISRE